MFHIFSFRLKINVVLELQKGIQIKSTALNKMKFQSFELSKLQKQARIKQENFTYSLTKNFS